jgi:hypothetical protein
MNEQTSSPRSFGRTALAVLIFLVAAYVLLHFVIGILSFLFSTALLVIAVVAVLWALKTIL